MAPDKTVTTETFADRSTVGQVRKTRCSPRSLQTGSYPITTDADTNDVVMLGYMNAELWRKRSRLVGHCGAGAGKVFSTRVRPAASSRGSSRRASTNQDAVWLPFGSQVRRQRHVGYRSCFYKSVELLGPTGEPVRLIFTEASRTFDPKGL